MKDKLLRIFNHYGIEAQKRKLNEECYEFLQAVAEWQNNPSRANAEHVTEELADCLVVLKQFQLSFEIADLTLEEFAILKTERTIQRIESEPLTDNLKEVTTNWNNSPKRL